MILSRFSQHVEYEPKGDKVFCIRLLDLDQITKISPERIPFGPSGKLSEAL